MAITPATAFSDVMANIVGNVGGAIQVLNKVSQVGGKIRVNISRFVLAAQASGTVFGLARIPTFASLLGIKAITDTSLATATLFFGDAANGNSAIYGAAQTLTATNALTTLTMPVAQFGTPIVNGYDCQTGAPTTYANNSGYGGGYEDIIMTTGVAALPGTGNLVVVVEYAID